MARDLTDRLLELGAALGVGLVVIFGTAAPWLPSIFSTDAEVQVQISALLPLAIGMLPINALVYQLDGILVGGSDFRWVPGPCSDPHWLQLGCPHEPQP